MRRFAIATLAVLLLMVSCTGTVPAADPEGGKAPAVTAAQPEKTAVPDTETPEGPAATETPVQELPEATEPSNQEDDMHLIPEHKEGELICSANSLEEAQKIADLYGITLDRYNYGVAVFVTDRDLMEVIREGKKNGWPALELNQIMHAF